MASPEKYGAMTLNERLYEAGLLDTFNDVVRQGDIAEIVALLKQVEISEPEAVKTADRIMAHPTRYGRLGGADAAGGNARDVDA